MPLELNIFFSGKSQFFFLPPLPPLPSPQLPPYPPFPSTPSLPSLPLNSLPPLHSPPLPLSLFSPRYCFLCRQNLQVLTM
ncbi:unnamed protein product [Closterium sp. Naga37s-1]|nr:unnamed protein product [Closterium sp. Naga37s-1]